MRRHLRAMRKIVGELDKRMETMQTRIVADVEQRLDVYGETHKVRSQELAKQLAAMLPASCCTTPRDGGNSDGE